MIVLTAAQAAALRGSDVPGHALEPVPLVDGMSYVLPKSVLDDPAHAAKRATLAALPVRAIASDEWPPAPDEVLPG